MTMTPNQIMQATVAGGSPDRRPAAVSEGGQWQLQRAGMTLPELFALPDAGAEMSLQAASDWNSDIVWNNGAGFGPLIEAMGCEVVYKVGAGGTIVRPALQSIDEVDKLPKDYDAIREAILANEHCGKLIEQLGKIVEGNDGYRTVALGLTGPFTFAGQMMVMDDFIKGVLRKPEQFRAYIEWAMQAQIVLADLLLDTGANMALMADPLSSGDVISPKVFESLAKPAITGVVRHIKQRSPQCMVAVHMCGHTTARLEGLKDVGLDIFSFDQNDLRESIEIVGDAYTLMGNVPTSELLLNGTPEQVREYCEGMLEVAQGHTKFILTAGCDMPPGAPLENILAMNNSVH